MLNRLKTTECRIGIVGLYSSGKTVLLTSLINHLQNHDPARFRLGSEGTLLKRFEALPPTDGWEKFNYDGHRDALVHGGHWPAKTRDRSQFVCRFERSDWTFSDALVIFYDLPGERIADGCMMGRSFRQWSDYVLETIRNDTPYRSACAPFLEAQQAGDSGTLRRTYKEALARLILQFKPFITPSTFLLDAHGNLARPAAPEVLAEQRFTGLDATREFVPLSEVACTRLPELAVAFAERYDAYRAEVVEPLFEALRSCHSLLVLTDITMLLAGGVGMYDDNRLMLRDLLRVLDPGESVFGTVVRGLSKVLLPRQLRPAWINRIAFVAPKLDLVHPLDRGRMVHLVQRLAEPYARNFEGLQTLYTNCAAVAATRVLPDDKERLLVGVPLRGPDGRKLSRGEEQRFSVSALPDEWPNDWQPGDYRFPEVYPRVPSRKDAPPEQINLDRILTFLLG